MSDILNKDFRIPIRNLTMKRIIMIQNSKLMKDVQDLSARTGKGNNDVSLFINRRGGF